MMTWQIFSRGMPKSFSSWNKVRWKWKRVVPEEGLEFSQGYHYRILSPLTYAWSNAKLAPIL